MAGCGVLGPILSTAPPWKTPISSIRTSWRRGPHFATRDRRNIRRRDERVPRVQRSRLAGGSTGNPRMSLPNKLDYVTRSDRIRVNVGDLDQRRNLKFRAFVLLVLRPLFDELEEKFGFRKMAFRGGAPGQYYQDFRNIPRPHGYGSVFERKHRIGLSRCVTQEGGGRDRAPRRVERLVLETRADLHGRDVLGGPPSMGFEPALGDSVPAGLGRVLHILTRPAAAPGQRQVHDVPEELRFLNVHRFEEPFPTVELLQQVDDEFEEMDLGDADGPVGVWGLPNSDVFQHVNALEYTFGMENRMTAVLAAAGQPLERFVAKRSQVIFRKPSFVGEKFTVRCRLFRRADDIIALGSFHKIDPGGARDERPSVALRLEVGMAVIG